MERRLAVILAADVAGYSRLMSEDEEGALNTLRAYRGTMDDLIAEHGGRIFGAAGDSVIAEFASAVQAVRAAVAVQRALHRRNADLPRARRMEFRVGINLGDVMVEGDNLLGDGVNIAARLQEIAAPAEICLSGAVHEQILGKLSFPITGLGERSLKNIPRPIQVYRADWQLDDPSMMGVLGGTLALPDKPSIAVLPFANMSGDPEQEYFADGITEDIITALSRYRWFFVIARNSTFAYKGRAADVKHVARDLGVRYVLEGSVRKAGNRVRVTAQLIEAQTANHLWAERFDRDYADIFAIQDEITESVVGAIEPEILIGEGQRALRKAKENLDAFDCCMRGMWHHYQFAETDNHQAETWLRRAIELEPKLAQAHVALARVVAGRILYGWSHDVGRDLAAAHQAAERAVLLDPRDPYTHYALSITSLMYHQHHQALSLAQRAVDLSPNFALGYMAVGWVRIYIGHFAEAIDPILRSLRLSPHDPVSPLFLSLLALAYYHQNSYEEAARYAELAIHGRRTYNILQTFLACLGQVERLEEAKAILLEMQRLQPPDVEHLWEVTSPYADPAHSAHLVEGLRKAGFTPATGGAEQ